MHWFWLRDRAPTSPHQGNQGRIPGCLQQLCQYLAGACHHPKGGRIPATASGSLQALVSTCFAFSDTYSVYKSACY